MEAAINPTQPYTPAITAAEGVRAGEVCLCEEYKVHWAHRVHVYRGTCVIPPRSPRCLPCTHTCSTPDPPCILPRPHAPSQSFSYRHDYTFFHLLNSLPWLHTGISEVQAAPCEFPPHTYGDPARKDALRSLLLQSARLGCCQLRLIRLARCLQALLILQQLLQGLQRIRHQLSLPALCSLPPLVPHFHLLTTRLYLSSPPLHLQIHDYGFYRLRFLPSSDLCIPRPTLPPFDITSVASLISPDALACATIH